MLCGVFVLAGTLHFVRPQMYEEIMPGYLPAHRELVLISGAAEIAGGVGVAARRTRRAAGWGLIAVLIAVFPANLNMALNPERYRQIPELLLWARLPLQAAAIWWAYRATHPRD
ncbi:MAG: DoxX family protein [Solirubrobacterales bacterium]|nr:DoxX family protein [Solirubrobacterales bacterium]